MVQVKTLIPKGPESLSGREIRAVLCSVLIHTGLLLPVPVPSLTGTDRHFSSFDHRSLCAVAHAGDFTRLVSVHPHASSMTLQCPCVTNRELMRARGSTLRAGQPGRADPQLGLRVLSQDSLVLGFRLAPNPSPS